MQISDFLTASIVAAIIIFVIREAVVEAREFRNKGRRTKAIRSALLREVQSNILAHNSILAAFSDAEDGFKMEPNGSFRIVKRPSGRTEYKSYYGTGEFRGGGVLREIANDYSRQVYIEAFELGGELAAAFEKYQDALSDLHHLRSGLFDYSEPGTFDESFFEGFIEWAYEEFPEVTETLKLSYLAFGGHGTTIPRLGTAPERKEGDETG